MHQRRVRLGDILDDYCPRERRITNHAVVAMVEDTVKQTRCTTCDADHEYKEAKVPAARRRRAGALSSPDVETLARPRPAAAAPDDDEHLPEHSPEPEVLAAQPDAEPAAPAEHVAAAEAVADAEVNEEDAGTTGTEGEEWPVHRRLIRATLPRPEGQAPERKTPDFTFRPAGGRFESPRNGHRSRGHRPMRHAQGQQPSGQNRFGGQRQGPGQGPRHGAGQGPGQGQGQGQGQRSGNRPGSQGGGRPGQGRGSRPGGGGRKRGR
jgi:hypothetical protein